MFGQQNFSQLIFGQVPAQDKAPGVAIPVWDVSCRATSDWIEDKKEQSTLNKCNKDL